MKKSHKGFALFVLAIFFALGFSQPSASLAAGPAQVDLLSADNFVVLTKTGITNTGSHTSAITGNIGSSPITAAAMNNIFCSEITGTIYGVNAAYVGNGNQSCFSGNPPAVNKTLVDNAVLDMGTAYANAAGRINPTATELSAGNIGGLTFAPGLYKWSTDVTLPTTVTLSGSANDVWIFQIAGNLSIASGGSISSGSKVILSGGAKASNVFWQVGGLTGATLGTYSTFNGNILSAKSIIMQTGSILNGRALAQTQVTLDASTVTMPTSTSNIAPLVGSITPISAVINNAKTFSTSYSDSNAVTSCSLYANGQRVGTMELSGSTNSGTTSLSHVFNSNGSNTLQARCTDISGNIGFGPVTTVLVSSQDVADATPPSAPTNVTLFSTGSTNNATITWYASSDNVGVSGYQVSIDGKTYTNIGNTLSYTTSSLDKGVHTITVRAQDNAGNLSSGTPLQFTIYQSSFTLPNSPTQESLFRDESWSVMNRNRTDLEISARRPCELSSATAASRVTSTLNIITDVMTRQKIENFIACGTPTTLYLGAGERLGIVNSYRAAFAHVPSTETEWNDVIKIGNGRFLSETSTTAETLAKANFRRVYLRNANTNTTGDNNAVMVMTYGLRPTNRNLHSEVAATTTFRAVFKRMPLSASDWDIVRGIAYSGTTR